MTNLSASNDNINHQALINTDELNDPTITSSNNDTIAVSPQSFNSKFFKDIDNSNNNDGGNILKKSFTRLEKNTNRNSKKHSNNRSFEDENLFDQVNTDLFNGANGDNNHDYDNILSSSPPVKIKLNNDKNYELIENGNSVNSNSNKLKFEEIVNKEENVLRNSTNNNIKKSNGIQSSVMGFLSVSSSSAFTEQVTFKERIKYFINFVIHHIKTSTIMTWLRVALLLCFIVGIVLAIFKFKVQNHLEILSEFVKKFGIPLGGLAYVGVFMLLIIFLIPVTIPTIIGGMIFKLWFGILFVWTGSILGGLVAFFLGRYVFRKRIAKRIEKNRKLLAVDQAIGQEGWKIVILLRLVPLIPESLLNYALSVTNVKFHHYLISSSIGMIPGCSFFVYVGSMITNISDIGNGAHLGKGEIAMYVISAVFMVCAILFITIIVKRAVNKKLEQDDQKGLLDEEEGLMNEQDGLISGNDNL